MTTDELAKIARDKKADFLALRSSLADFDTLKIAASEYMDACAAWHKVRFPGKKFKRQSAGYLIRAL
jgi:hypothetical protein